MRDSLFTLKSVFDGVWEFASVKFWSSLLVPLFGVFFGFENPAILQALFLLTAIDFVTGVCSARVAGEQIKSRIAVKSAYKVAVYGLLVSSGHLAEMITPGGTFIEEAVTSFLALTELISIIENVGKMGFAVPNKLLNQLQKLREGTSLPEPKRKK